MLRDVASALRSLRNHRGFAAVAVLVLALGIGANTAIFSVINAVLIRPLPYAEPDRLALLWERIPNLGDRNMRVPAAQYPDFRERFTQAEAVGAYDSLQFNLAGPSQPERLNAARISANLFHLLGATAHRGRLFTSEEEQRGNEQRVVLTHALWQKLGGSDSLIGSTVRLDGKPYLVLGVTPPGFDFPPTLPAELYVPMILQPAELEDKFDNFDTQIIARLKPGVTLEQAKAQANQIALYEESLLPPRAKGAFQLRGDATWLTEEVTGKIRPAMLVLAGAVAFVLLIACANIASLMLARSASRRRELAIRAALGAGKSQLARLVLTESLVLSAIGGIAGLMLALWATDLLVRFAPLDIPQIQLAALDWRVLVFAAGLSLFTGLLFGLLPALQAMDAPADALKDGSRSSTGRSRVRQMLVVAEVALSVILLTGAGLQLKSFWKLRAVDAGFQPDGVLTYAVALPATQYPDNQKVLAFHRSLSDAIRSIPGVQAAGAGTTLPVVEGWTILFTPDNYAQSTWTNTTAKQHAVLPGYHESLQIALRKGRLIGANDVKGQPPVVVVNETMAKRFWPGEEVVGRKLKWGSPSGGGAWMTIVGVVADVKQAGLDSEVTPATYMPLAQIEGLPLDRLIMNYTVRTAGNPIAIAPAVRAEVQKLDASLPIFRLQTMNDVVSESLAPRRFNTTLMALFAGLALLLAATGLYGVLAYMVAQSTREIGIRVALGASMVDVLRRVLSSGLRLVLAGLAIGIAGALSLSKVLSGLLYEVSPTDFTVLAGVSLALFLVAVAACMVPARRAAAVDPVVALRCE